MNKHLWISLAAILFVASATFVASRSSAQPPAGGTAKKGATKKGQKKQPVVEEKDPVVLTIRESKPQTPQELVRAIQVMMNIKRVDEAKKYLGRLVSRNLNPSQLAALQRKFGTGFFFKLQRDAGMAPEGEQFAKAVIKSSYEAARDPARLQQLISQLTDPSSDVRSKALVELQEGRTPAVKALIAAMWKAASGGQQQAPTRAALRSALVYLKKSSEQPLLASLSATNPIFLAEVIQVLEQIRSRDSVPLMLYAATSPKSTARLREVSQKALVTLIGGRVRLGQAKRFLDRQAVKAFRASLPGPRSTANGTQVSWEWVAASNSLNVHPFEAKRVVAMVAANRLARDAYRLAPTEKHHKKLYAATLLELAKLRVGLDGKLPRGAGTPFAEAAAMGVETVTEALQYCLALRHIPGALAATEVLGAIGKEDLLYTKRGSSSPLSNVVQDKDRRLRYQGAISIAQINPQESFVGASRVTDVLKTLIGTKGVRRALVAHPKLARAQTLVGMLNELGYVADKATSSRMLHRIATREQDYDLILVSDKLDHPRVGELAQMIRQDIRTASIPVGILARQSTYRRLEIKTEKDRLTQVISQPNTVKSMQQEVQLLLRVAGRNRISPDERILQATDALNVVAMLVKSNSQVFHLRRLEPAVVQALYVPQLCKTSAAILGTWATPEAQRALLTVATDENRALLDRQAAGAAFAAAVKKRGLVVTSSDLAVAYRRIQRTTKLDPLRQQVVKQVMSAISSVTQPKKTRRPAGASRNQ